LFTSLEIIDNVDCGSGTPTTYTIRGKFVNRLRKVSIRFDSNSCSKFGACKKAAIFFCSLK